jgi:hypothetical protein
MSETADFDRGNWRGHDFGSARDTYDVHVGRSYSKAVSSGVKMEDLVPETLKTNSPAPLVILCDVTGSMGEWPTTIFSKLPYLELEGQEYLGKKMEIAWGAVGDAQCGDRYPLQMRQFTKGTKLKDELEKLVIEGGGGGGMKESYELAALYCARNIEMPKAINPLCIIIGDEGFYDIVDKGDVKKFAYASMQDSLTAKEVFDELQRKFSVYLIRKRYDRYRTDGDEMSPSDKNIYKQWEEVLGADRISVLPEAGRVVDVIFGILANETNRVEYFRDELVDRQSKDDDGPEKIETVMKSLETIHQVSDGKDVKLLRSGKSITRKSKKGKKTKSLL